MTYILKLRGGEEFEITEEDRAEVLKTRSGSVYLKSIDVSFDVELVATTYPKSIADEREKRRTQQLGILHDGSRVKRYFGEWVLTNQETVDDNGKGVPVKIDPTHYPEVSRDCVPTPEEWEAKYKMLPEKERLELIVKGHEAPRLTSGEFLSSLVNKKYDLKGQVD